MKIQFDLQSFHLKIVFLLLFPGLLFKFIDNVLGIDRPTIIFWVIGYVGALVLIKKNITGVLLCALIYFLILIISYLFTHDDGIKNFFQKIVLHNIFPLLIGLSVTYREKPLYSTIEKLFYANLIIIILNLFTNYLNFDNDRILLFSKISGINEITVGFETGNLFGAYASLTFYLIAKNQFKFNKYLFFNFLLAFITLIIIGSRGALIGTIIVMLLTTGLKNIKLYIYLLILTSIILLTSIFISSERLIFLLEPFIFLQKIFVYDSCSLGSEGSFAAHYTLYKEAIRLFISSPILGIGAGNFGYQYCGPPIEFASPHSIILHLLVEFGAIFFIPVALFIGCTLIKSLEFIKYKSENYASIAIVYIFTFIQLQFSGNLYIDFQYYMILGIIINIIKKKGSMI